MTTLVSSFYRNINNRVDRTFEDYMNYGKLLLTANIPKIIFTDKETYDKINIFENENTKILISKKEDIYLYQYIDLITNFNVNTKTPDKDTIEYMFMMCNKTEIIRKAIEFNFFNTDNFIWVDFGIKHIFNCTDEEFNHKIERLNNIKYDKVRIGSIWNLNMKYFVNNLNDICWYFAGGVFGGNKDYLINFANKTKDMCIKIMNENKTITWEVNIWYMVYIENPNIFFYYCCDHNSSLIDNY